MKHTSFTTKLLVAFWGVLLLAFFLTALLLSRYVRQDISEAATTRALQALKSLDWSISQRDAFQSAKDFDDWLSEIGNRLQFRITYIDQGRVIADSQVPYASLGKLDDHATRPEIIQALAEGTGTSQRFSKTLNKYLLYAAMRVSGTQGIPSGVLRVAIPLSVMQDKYANIMPHLLGLLALAFCLTSGIGIFMSRRLGRSIRDFTHVAQRIGRGDYQDRLHLAPGREFTPLAEAINTMAEQIQKHIHSLEEKKGELEALFNGLTSGVMILNKVGRIESWNHALETFYPDMGNARGKTPLEATMQPELQELTDKMKSSSQTSGKLETQLQTQGKKLLHAILMFFQTPRGVRKIVIVLHDITELKRLERVRQDFMANISHEIRTPVTCIKGYAETLLDQPGLPKETEEKFLRTILENADHMGNLVAKLLALSKLDAQIQNALEPVSIQDTLDAALRTLSQTLEAREMTVIDEFSEEAVLVQATKAGLFEVLVNLLENAVNYGTDGMNIFVGATRKNGTVILYVKDQGPGIPEVYRERIFERFFRVESGRKGSKGHYGLGLAICRQIIAGFGGEIRIECPKDDAIGTIFYVTLQAANLEQSDHPTAARNVA